MGACAPPRRPRSHLCVSHAAVPSWKRVIALLRLELPLNPRAGPVAVAALNTILLVL